MARGVLNIPSGEREWSGGTFIRRVHLKEDKESCRIRFLTEDDDVFFAGFHENKNPPLFGDVCVNEADGRACDLCDKNVRLGTKWLAWVYEYTHDYIDEDDVPEGIDYKTVELGSGKKIYRVEVNDVGLMCYARGHKGSIVHFSEKYGTLLDRDYEWSRNGKAKDMETSYMLEPEDKEKMSSELKSIMKELPDLEKVATGEVTILDNEEEEETPNPRKEKKISTSSDIIADAVEESTEEEEEEGAPF